MARAWAPWLQDPDLKRWHDDLARKAPRTATERMTVLHRLCAKLAMGPHDIAALARKDPKKASDLLMDYVTREEQRATKRGGTVTGGSIKNDLKVLRSWLRHNDILLARWPSVKDAMVTRVQQVERIPEPEELQRALAMASVRLRAAMSIIAYAGTRPESLANDRGTDGLKVKDFPELRIRGGEVTWEAMPAVLVVRKELSKAKHQYATFMAAEGCDALKLHLEERIAAGEAMGPDSPILASERDHEPRHVTTDTLCRQVRHVLERAGIRDTQGKTARPYVLRSYFDHQLLLAESAGAISHSYGQAWMGHKGDIEQVYTTRKGQLTSEMLRDMRSKYQAAEPYLTGQEAPTPTQDAKAMEERIAALEALVKEAFIEMKVGGVSRGFIAKADLPALQEAKA